MPPDGRHCSICGAPPTTEPVARPHNPNLALATTALVLGIIGFLGSLLLIGLPFAIAAIVIGALVISGNRPGRGMGIAGLVLGIVGTGVALILLAAVIALAILGVDLESFAETGRLSATTLP